MAKIESESKIGSPVEEAGIGKTIGSFLVVAAMTMFDLYMIFEILKRFLMGGDAPSKFRDAYRAAGEGILKRFIRSESFWSIAHPTFLTLLYFAIFWYITIIGASGIFWRLLRFIVCFVENYVLGRISDFKTKIPLIRGLFVSARVLIHIMPRRQLPVILGLILLFLLINWHYADILFSRLGSLIT